MGEGTQVREVMQNTDFWRGHDWCSYNFQRLWLLAQDCHETGPVNTLLLEGVGPFLLRIYPVNK